MARGWESKSVEEQQSQAAAAAPLTSEQKERLKKENAEKARKVQGLKLMRARVVEQLERSQNPRYAEMLRHQLEQLDKQISDLS